MVIHNAPMMKLVKMLKFMEDPKYPCLGPNIRLLNFIGIWHPKITLLSRTKLIIVYLNLAFYFSQYVKCLINFNSDALKLILQYAPFHMGVVKTCFFQKDYKKWERLVAFISKVELHQMSKKDELQGALLNDYVYRSRRVTYFFWMLALFSNFSIFTEPYQKNRINENGTSVFVYIFDGYTPFSREPPGYYYSMFIQTIFGNMMTVYVVGWDMLVVSIMIFFAGQLKTSTLYCSRAVDSKNMQESHRNIADCHRFHTDLIWYQREFNELISPVMFIYLVVIAVNLGVQIIQIAEIKDDLPTLVSGCVFILACLIQLLLFYWHGNEVTVESQLVSYGTFESKWVEADRKIQKEVALLNLTTNKRLVFSAGPFNEMSLSTFVMILRASYSFYTLLKGTN